MQLTYYSVRKQTIDISDIRLVMSTTSIDPAQQDASATSTPSATTELPDPSTYKVYRPPDVPGPTSSKRQCKVPVTDSALLTDL